MKRFILPLLSLLMIAFVGCSNKATVEDSKAPVSGVENTKTEEIKEEAKEMPPVMIEELPFEVTILEPDSIGTVYMEATYTNNSKLAVKSFNITALLKDKNEKAYLSNYDTVMPGETSPKFETFGPDTRSSDDIEYLKYEINLVDENGNDIYLDYDVKLKQYTWY